MKKFTTLLLAASLMLGSSANAVLIKKTATFTGVFGRGGYTSLFGGVINLVGQSFVMKFDYAVDPGDVAISAYGVTNDPHFISHSLTINGVTYSTTNSNRVATARLQPNSGDGGFQASFTLGGNNPTRSSDDFTATPLVNCNVTCYSSLDVNADYTSRLIPGGRITLSAASYFDDEQAYDFTADTADGSLDSFTITDYAGAVPEPASWAMLIAGFGLVGAVNRRRRSTLAVTA